MKLSYKLFITFLLIYLAVYAFTPTSIEIIFLFNLILLYPIYTIFISIYQKKFSSSKNISPGLFFLFVMLAFMVIGNLNYLIISFIWPLYYMDTTVTNLYFTLCIISFGTGYFLILKGENKIMLKNYFYYIDTKKVVIIFALIGSIGSVLIINIAGELPFFAGKGKERLEIFETVGPIIYLWKLNILAGVFSFFLILNETKGRLLFILIFGLSILQLIAMSVRFDFSLVLTTCFLVFIYLKHINRKMWIWMAIIAFMGLNINALFLSDREEYNPAFEQGMGLSNVQTQLIFRTFNEFTQLGTLIYKLDEFRYGSTFLNVPVSFVPSSILEAFDISKEEIRKNNSATILAQLEGVYTKENVGLRSGIGGEMYVNFGFWGALGLIFMGMIFGFIENHLNSISNYDIRFNLFMILLGILTYSLIGQIDGISQSIVFFSFIMMILFIFSKEYVIVEDAIQSEQ